MPSGSDGFQQTVAVLLTIIGVLAAVSGGINVRSGILTGPDGVTVRTGTGRRTYVRWADVQGFQLVPGRLSKRTVMVTVIRPGLPALSCRAASFSARDARAERTLDDLRSAFRNWSPGSAVTG